MYWPIGTPRIYATTTNQSETNKVVISHDGLLAPEIGRASEDRRTERFSLLSPDPAGTQDSLGAPPQTPLTPITPATPLTPGIKPVEDDYHDGKAPDQLDRPSPARLPSKEPILALCVARSGHMFVVITATTMTVWQTKVCDRCIH